MSAWNCARTCVSLLGARLDRLILHADLARGLHQLLRQIVGHARRARSRAVGFVVPRPILQRGEPRLQALHVLLRGRLLRLQLRQPLVAQGLDVLHRAVGIEQKIVALLLRPLLRLRAFRGGALRGSLFRIDVADLHALAVEQVPPVTRVLRRHAVAVVHDTMRVHPTVDDAAALVAVLRQYRARDAGEREEQSGTPMR